jgi:hypothetical protein
VFLAPGCLVSSKYSQLFDIFVYFNSVLVFLVVVEIFINDIGNHLDLACGELQAVKNAPHLEGPLNYLLGSAGLSFTWD